MNGVMKFFFILGAGLVSLTGALADEKKEGTADEWAAAATKSLKAVNDLSKSLKDEVAKLKSKDSSSSSVKAVDEEQPKYVALVEKVTAAKKTHDASKKSDKSEELKAIVKAGVEAAEGYEAFVGKYLTALKAVVTAQTTELGSASKLLLFNIKLGSHASGFVRYAMLPIMATAAFVLL
ncbi:hypothetical protein BgAZ_305580 [Babesia gibsoni]|uniref:Uncharacterized protein n=1 Tax=Babesia gibsoni TaxID=33632 RepID=A0AAD8P910_BABGI|nr:hypothetical protein BgAZ_305580 [Babesia gibsoni]